MDSDSDRDSMESYYPFLQSISFLLGMTVSAFIIKAVTKKIGYEIDYGFNVYKLVKDA